MSRSMLSHDTDTAQASKTKMKTGPSGLRVNKPGDSYEIEADRVADTVSSGGRVESWSLAASGFGGIQRQSTPAGAAIGPPPAPQGQTTGDILPKLAEAFMGTSAGKAILAMIQGDPLVKGATDFVTTPTGMVVAGTSAIGTVSALAATHQPLPLQIPKIPLDALYPGLGVKITYEGPVDHPTAASLVVSFEGKAPATKPKQTASEAYRAETARMAADQEKFRAGMQPRAVLGPEQTPEQKAIDAYNLRRMTAAVGFGDKAAASGGGPLTGAPLAGPATAPPAPVTGLQMPGFVDPLKPKAPTLLDKQLELKPLTSPAQVEADAKKKEEIPVQRKADASAEVFAESADVDSVLGSSGRPLDHETRRFMESHIGFDFGKVRLHSDARAAASARSMGAHAYTVGSDLVFAAGQYAPQTTAGRRLLAHELTHVVQQESGAGRVPRSVRAAVPQVQRRFADEGNFKSDDVDKGNEVPRGE